MMDDSSSGMNEPREEIVSHGARWLSCDTQGACAGCSFFPYQRQVDAILGSHYFEADLGLPIRISGPGGGYYHASYIREVSTTFTRPSSVRVALVLSGYRFEFSQSGTVVRHFLNEAQLAPVLDWPDSFLPPRRCLELLNNRQQGAPRVEITLPTPGPSHYNSHR
jgi:hypothetical protein